jgi:hypothetical protein
MDKPHARSIDRFFLVVVVILAIFLVSLVAAIYPRGSDGPPSASR